MSSKSWYFIDIFFFFKLGIRLSNHLSMEVLVHFLIKFFKNFLYNAHFSFFVVFDFYVQLLRNWIIHLVERLFSLSWDYSCFEVLWLMSCCKTFWRLSLFYVCPLLKLQLWNISRGIIFFSQCCISSTVHNC